MRHATALCGLVAVLAASSLCAQETKDGQPVEMKASDGTAITGKLYGKGPTALVLCHGRAYTKGAESFAEEARWLASKGLMCLALSFRGYPGDTPAATMAGQDLDIVAAFDHVVGLGARRIYVLGSSMGGFATFKALAALGEKPQFAGIIILSAFHPQVTGREPGRKLFVVAEDDRRLYPKVMVTFIKTASPKQAIVFKKGGHGQQLFKTHAKELLEAIRLFAVMGSLAPGSGER